MKKRYKSIILFDLPDERSCLVNLSAIKWSERYKCRKCGNAKNFKGKKEFDKRWTRCSDVESLTAGTQFNL